MTPSAEAGAASRREPGRPPEDPREKRTTPPGVRPELLRATAVVSGAAGVSRVLGFVRDMAMAWLLGGGPAADALVAALRLPYVLRRLLGEGSLSMTLTAALVRGGTAALPDGGPDLPRMAGLARAVAVRLAGTLAVVVLAGVFCARPLIGVLAPGLEHAAVAEQAALLLRICLPYAFFAVMAALSMALLHSARRFLPPALAPAFFNCTVLVFAALAACGFGPPAALLAWGFLCGGLAQWLSQAVAVRRSGMLRHALPPPPGAARRCLRRLPGGVLGAAAPQLAMLCAMAAASWLPSGGMASLYYAERLVEVPLGVAGAALGIAGLPALAGLAAEGRHGEFADEASAALRLSLLVMLPAMVGLTAVARPLVELLFARGAFDAQAVAATATALCGYAPGLPAYGLIRPLLAACNARQQIGLTSASGVAAVASTLAAAAVLIHSLPERYALLGPPLAVSAALWLQVGLLWTGLNRGLRLRGTRLRLPRTALARQAAGSLATGVAALWTVHLLEGSVWALPAGVAAGVAAYAAALSALGDPDIRALCGRAGRHTTGETRT